MRSSGRGTDRKSINSSSRLSSNAYISDTQIQQTRSKLQKYSDRLLDEQLFSLTSLTLSSNDKSHNSTKLNSLSRKPLNRSVVPADNINSSKSFESSFSFPKPKPKVDYPHLRTRLMTTEKKGMKKSDPNSSDLHNETTPEDNSAGRDFDEFDIDDVIRSSQTLEKSRNHLAPLEINNDPVSSTLSEWHTPIRLYCWGTCPVGQLGLGPGIQNATYPVQCPFPNPTYFQNISSNVSMGSMGSVISTDVAPTPAKVAAGYGFSCVIDSNRKVWISGEGFLGVSEPQIGSLYGAPSVERTRIFRPVRGLENVSVVDISCGDGFVVVCSNLGHVYTWGKNDLKRLMSSTIGPGGSSNKIPLLNPASSGLPTNSNVSVGGNGRDVEVKCEGASLPWGSSGAASSKSGIIHPLGVPHTFPLLLLEPTRVLDSLEHEIVVSVSAGKAHVLALTANGHVYSWGSGVVGACGQGVLGPVLAPARITVPLHPGQALGNRSSNNGRILLTGSSGAPHSVPSNSSSSSNSSSAPVIGMGLGGGQSDLLVGVSSLGPYHEPPAFLRPSYDEGGKSQLENTLLVHQISAGAYHSLLLARDGSVFSFGFGSQGRLGLDFAHLQKYKQSPHIPSDSVGNNGTGLIVASPTKIQVPPVTSVAAGGAHSVFATVDGRVLVCGSNSFGACSVNTRPILNADAKWRAANDASLMAQRSHGSSLSSTLGSTIGSLGGLGCASGLQQRPTEITTENEVFLPRQVYTSLFGNVVVTRVLAGTHHTLAVALDGTMWAWGENTEGSCGVSLDSVVIEPVIISKLAKLRPASISCGDGVTLAAMMRGRLARSGRATEEEALGGGAELELPAQLKKIRKQAITVRTNAIAYAHAQRRRRLRLARRRTLRSVITAEMALRGGKKYINAISVASDLGGTSKSAFAHINAYWRNYDSHIQSVVQGSQNESTMNPDSTLGNDHRDSSSPSLSNSSVYKTYPSSQKSVSISPRVESSDTSSSLGTNNVSKSAMKKKSSFREFPVVHANLQSDTILGRINIDTSNSNSGLRSPSLSFKSDMSNSRNSLPMDNSVINSMNQSSLRGSHSFVNSLPISANGSPSADPSRASRINLPEFELEVDDAEYGKNLAAFIIQGFFKRILHMRKRLNQLKRKVRSFANIQAAFFRSSSKSSVSKTNLPVG